MQRMPTKSGTVFHQFQTFGTTSLLDHTVIPQTSLCTLKPNIFPHWETPSRPNRKLPAHQLTINRQRIHFVPDNPAPPQQREPRTQQNYSIIFVTTPEPTVRPPSRIAKRLPCSIAICLPRVTSTFTLSPGMHISAPPRRSVVPVTSVVRK